MTSQWVTSGAARYALHRTPFFRNYAKWVRAACQWDTPLLSRYLTPSAANLTSSCVWAMPKSPPLLEDQEVQHNRNGTSASGAHNPPSLPVNHCCLPRTSLHIPALISSPCSSVTTRWPLCLVAGSLACSCWDFAAFAWRFRLVPLFKCMPHDWL